MANKTVTVKPSGGDYTSLNAALAGESANLVTNTCVLTIECYDMDDTTAASTGTGYTTSASYYINIVGDSSKAMDGKWDTGRYILSVSAATPLTISEGHVRFFGLQILSTTTGTENSNGIYLTGIPTASGNFHIIDSCILKAAADGTGSNYCIRAGDGDAALKIFNTLVLDFVSGTDGQHQGIYAPLGTCEIYNCVVHNCRTGITDGGTGTMTIKNTVVFDCNDDIVCSGTVDYCATDDNDGTNNVDETAGGTKTWADCFTDYTNDDFSLKAGSPLIGAGVDDPGSGLFSDDITGTTRSDWDVGAFEYVSAGGDPEGCLIAGKLLRGGLLMHGVLTRA